ncbi:solute carrier family 66 member 3 isoform X2 [Tachypleus tridentatus]|uniref:solute carrier family 66 member 3 isoform X2 n=1 Tax=Tachypleus tridentatus TaxID=6853 RepID=UPI003FCEEA09
MYEYAVCYMFPRATSKQVVKTSYWKRRYSTMISYAYANKYPFTAFSEYPFLVIQDFILLIMILHYSKSSGILWVIYFALIAIIQYCIALEHLPKTFVSAVVNLGIPIAVGSKLLQLGAIILSKDAGQVSGLTWKIAAYTSAARILTYTFEVWDLVLLLYHSLSFALNSAIAVAAIVYRKPVTKEG